jgi:hypothetical protein
MWRLNPESAAALKSTSPLLHVSTRKIEQTTARAASSSKHTFSIEAQRLGRMTVEFLYDNINTPSIAPTRRSPARHHRRRMIAGRCETLCSFARPSWHWG